MSHDEWVEPPTVGMRARYWLFANDDEGTASIEASITHDLLRDMLTALQTTERERDETRAELDTLIDDVLWHLLQPRTVRHDPYEGWDGYFECDCGNPERHDYDGRVSATEQTLALLDRLVSEGRLEPPHSAEDQQ